MATNNAINFAIPTTINEGMTAGTSFTAYAPLCGGSVSTSALQQATTGISTSGFALTSQGAGALPQFAALTSSSLVFIKTLSPSAVASTSFTSSDITSTYTSYMIKFVNISVASNTSGFFKMTWSTNNGSSYLSTGYLSGINSNSYNSNAFSNANNTTYAQISQTMNTAGFLFSGQIFIQLPQSSVASYVGRLFQTAGTNSAVQTYGYNSGTTTINNIQFALSSGLNFSGTISLYGITQ